MSIGFFFKMVAATLSVLFTFGTTQSGMIGHRGYSGIYPDNTEKAFIMAAKAGAVGCETDVRITSDGYFVLSHNSAAEYKDGTELEVSEHTLAELTAKPLNNIFNQYLCTYERFLEIAKEYDLVCFVELKGTWSDDNIKAVFDIAREKYDINKCILQSFNFDNLVKARELVKDLPIMLTYDADFGDYTRCFEYGFSLDGDYSTITEEMVKEFHDRGLLIAAWTCNDPFSVGYCKSLGLDYIESDLFMW